MRPVYSRTGFFLPTLGVGGIILGLISGIGFGAMVSLLGGAGLLLVFGGLGVWALLTIGSVQVDDRGVTQRCTHGKYFLGWSDVVEIERDRSTMVLRGNAGQRLPVAHVYYRDGSELGTAVLEHAERLGIPIRWDTSASARIPWHVRVRS